MDAQIKTEFGLSADEYDALIKDPASAQKTAAAVSKGLIVVEG